MKALWGELTRRERLMYSVAAAAVLIGISNVGYLTIKILENIL